MIPSLKPEVFRVVIACLVIIISTLIYLVAPAWEGPFQKSEIISWELICVLQIIGGIFLFIGSLIDNHCLFLPWLGSSVIFIYTIIFRSCVYLWVVPSKPESFLPYMHIIAGLFWIYFVHDIFRDFLQMYYESKEQIWKVEAMDSSL
ncbi:hypothetical protein KR026_003748, partial [Drosophila bipectinata]